MAKHARAASRELETDYARDGVFDAQKALRNPGYMAQIPERRIQKQAVWEKNGITQADVKQAFDEGYAAAQKDLAVFIMRMFYGACCIALKNKFGFGETRIVRALEEIHRIMTEELCSEDMLERVRRETGIDLKDDLEA